MDLSGGFELGLGRAQRPAGAPNGETEKTGRRCRGVELDPRYLAVIVHRYHAATNTEAVLENTGETWTEVSARRAREFELRRKIDRQAQ
jgi:hypothetical protein